MVCPFCNAPVNPGMAFCTNCGNHIAGKIQYNQSYQMPQQMPNYQPYPTPQQTPGYTNYPANNLTEQPLSMKWYKWLLVVLIIGAIFNLVSGIMNIANPSMGLPYFSSLDYQYTPGLREAMDYLETVNVFSGFFCIAMAVLGIVARIQLAGYKKSAPKLLVSMYAIDAVVNVLALVIMTSKLEELLGSAYDTGAVISESFSTIAVSIAFAIGNYSYFKKRAHLFVK